MLLDRDGDGRQNSTRYWKKVRREQNVVVTAAKLVCHGLHLGERELLLSGLTLDRTRAKRRKDVYDHFL